MKCDYCGRANTDDGHGGCVKCGAPVPQQRHYQHDSELREFAATCCSSYSYSPRQPISRKRVTLG